MHFVISFLMAPNYAAMRSKKKNMTDSFWHCGDSETYWFLTRCMSCIITKKNIKNDFLNNENKKDLEYLQVLNISYTTKVKNHNKFNSQALYVTNSITYQRTSLISMGGWTNTLFITKTDNIQLIDQMQNAFQIL